MNLSPQVQESAISPAEEYCWNENSVNLVGSFENPLNPRITVVALHRVLADVAIAAMDLHRFVHHHVQLFAAEHFGNGALRSVLLDRLLVAFVIIRTIVIQGGDPVTQHTCNPVYYRLGGKNGGRHVGNFFLDCAKFADRLAELLPLARIRSSLAKRRLGHAERLRRHFQPPHVEHVEGDLVPLAGFAEQVLDRHPDILQHQRGGGGAFESHLLFLGAYRESLKTLLHQERGELFAVDFGKYGEQVGKRRIRDELLGAVKDVVRTVGTQNRRGTGTQGVAAAIGFGQGVGAEPFTRGEFPQIPFLLIGGSVVHQRQHADAGMAPKGHDERSHRRDLLDHEHIGGLFQLQAAVLLGHFGEKESQIGTLLQLFDEEIKILVLYPLDIRIYLVLHELFGCLPYLALFRGKVFGYENVRT